MRYDNMVIGLELGSTRIKAVLVNEQFEIAAEGFHDWENRLQNGVWTYTKEDIDEGIRDCFNKLKKDAFNKYGEVLKRVAGIGVSAMMHGYLPFDKDGKQLAEFRTWRNTMTKEAAEELTALFNFNIPQRWSIAHLYQAILKGEDHVKDISYLTTLAGAIHWKLTGEKVMGIGEASGMFPIDSEIRDYDQTFISQFDEKIKDKHYPWKLKDILPKVLTAGENAGKLTEEGALYLDPEGDLMPGIPVAPCEGDAGTGMAATNSVRVYTGNVSAGTSDFAMIVTDHTPGVHREIDMVTTPSGAPVAMVHCNNCTSDINAWVNMFSEFAESIGHPLEKGELYTMLFKKALEGETDAGGLLHYNYYSGEGVTDVDEGRPVFIRKPDSVMSLSNVMRSQLMSALSTLKIGLDILIMEEKVRVDKLYGHGGFFKTPGVGQLFLSAASEAPVLSMKTAGEGGPYGMALLSAYLVQKEEGESLEDFLQNRVFAKAEVTEIMADEKDIEGFRNYLKAYRESFSVETEAIKTF